MMFYENALKAFSRKLGNTKRITFKDHKIEWLGFHNFDSKPNEISLTMDIDDRSLHIPLTPQEAETLLIKLTDSINKFKSQSTKTV